jgi:hypothetical protein
MSPGMRDKFRKLVAFTLRESMDDPPAPRSQQEFDAWMDRVIEKWSERVGFFEVRDQ